MILVVAIGIMGLGGGLFAVEDPAIPGRGKALLTFYAPLAVSAAGLVWMLLASSLRLFRVALGLHVLGYMLTVPATSDGHSVGILLLAGIVAELGLFEPYPRNLAETLGITAATVALRFSTMVSAGSRLFAAATAQLPALAVGVIESVLSCNVSRYRELAVDLVSRQDRLADSVVQLTRANSIYQDAAVNAQERAAEKERQRITRDIHDIVGYTLTNNIMLLEAAMDLMRENPLALPSVIETARSNAGEGLGRIRAALYKLRRQESWYPVGVDAIHRLVVLFERATRIRVRCEFCNLPRSISSRVDSTLYHLVQECLVNAFRHAGASEIRIVFWYGDGAVRLQVSDNGAGTESVVEGIGIRGMRERVHALGGELQVNPSSHGFAVAATIPVEESDPDGEDPDTHRC